MIVTLYQIGVQAIAGGSLLLFVAYWPFFLKKPLPRSAEFGLAAAGLLLIISGIYALMSGYWPMQS